MAVGQAIKLFIHLQCLPGHGCWSRGCACWSRILPSLIWKEDAVPWLERSARTVPTPCATRRGGWTWSTTTKAASSAPSPFPRVVQRRQFIFLPQILSPVFQSLPEIKIGYQVLHKSRETAITCPNQPLIVLPQFDFKLEQINLRSGTSMSILVGIRVVSCFAPVLVKVRPS
jgi:hypothetical protein